MIGIKDEMKEGVNDRKEKRVDDAVVNMILSENRSRRERRRFDPESGGNSPGRRLRVEMKCPLLGTGTLFLPATMMDTELGHSVITSCGVADFARSRELAPERVAEMFELVRLRHDFPYWASKYGLIRPKRGGENVPLRLNSAQRKLVSQLEDMRTAGLPIRIILLKARQWGGSTVIQLYMVWMQLVRGVGLNSLIVAHQNVATEDIRAMMKRVIDGYPSRLLRADFEAAEKGLLEARVEKPPVKSGKKVNAERTEAEGEGERKSPLKSVGRSGNTWHLPERNCDFRIGTAERPDSSRGGSYSLVHLSEVGIWRATDGKSPAEIVISSTSGVLAEPETMIVLESTAKGTGNYFHREYTAASRGEAQWRPVFIAWFDIDQYELPLDNPEGFASELFAGKERGDSTDRSESGQYLWKLWEAGATLEAINWYIWERRKYDSSRAMASEYPSDDREAFAAAGNSVFPGDLILAMEGRCRSPRVTHVNGIEMRIWSEPEAGREYLITFRPGTPEKGERAAGVVLDVSVGGEPRIVAEIAGKAGLNEGINALVELCRRYEDCRVAVIAERNEILGCGHALYAAGVIADEEILLNRPSRQELIWRISAELKTAAIDCLRDMIVRGKWSEPGSEAIAQMETLEADPAEGYRPVWGNRDDLLSLRAIACYLDSEAVN